jgi:predicted kinase
VPRLIHVNGPPGIGKSTLARRYVEEHAGVLNCDIDVLRTLIGGWRQDFEAAGALIRPAALALIAAYLQGGNDVILPQMLTRTDELRRFEAVAAATNAQFVEIMLMDDLGAVVDRFHRRGESGEPDAWHGEVRSIVADAGGDAVLVRCHQQLQRLVAVRPGTVVIETREGMLGAAYQALQAALDNVG